MTHHDENWIRRRIQELLGTLFGELHAGSSKIEPDMTRPAGSTVDRGHTRGYIPGQESVWDRLIHEGNHRLVEKLHKAEQGEYRVIVVPREGFSENDQTHNAVIQWLKDHNIFTLNPTREISLLENALHHPEVLIKD